VLLKLVGALTLALRLVLSLVEEHPELLVLLDGRLVAFEFAAGRGRRVASRARACARLSFDEKRASAASFAATRASRTTVATFSLRRVTFRFSRSACDMDDWERRENK